MSATQSVCVVTGGTHGIGRHLAETLAGDGWAVAVCSRHDSEATTAAAEIGAKWKVPTLGAACDVADPRAVMSFADAVGVALGPAGAVIANAAVLGPVGLLHTVDLGAWAEAVRVDLCGVANTVAAFTPGMIDRGSGSFVTLSGGGVGGPGMATRMSAYTSSKAAVVALTESLAAELEPVGVRINAVAPGAIATRFMDPVIAAGPEVVGVELHEQVTAQRLQPASLDRFVALIRFLLDPAAPFVTGRTLSARWDSPESLRASPPAGSSSRFRLRRIDEDLYGELGRDGELMRVVVTGGAGFIGSNLSDALLQAGHHVVVIDNLSTGRESFLTEAQRAPAFELVRADLVADTDRLAEVVSGADAVVHLAANADVRFGWQWPYRDLEQNVVATHNVLEAMRQTGVTRLLFSSTGSVYGEAPVTPTPENCPFPTQTSLYGASKAAAEGFIQAYAEGVGMRTTVFRFVSILGPRYTHGHVIDFVRKLRTDPSRLDILGDGRQRKSYLYVEDCVAAILAQLDQESAHEVFNLGTEEYCTVDQSAGWICERLGLQPEFVYSGGAGWIGDNPFIFLDTAKIRATGWRPSTTIREAVERTVDYLLASPDVVASESLA